MDQSRIVTALERGDLASEGIGVLIALTMILLLRLLLAKHERGLIITPSVFLICHIIVFGIRTITPATSDAQRPLALTALFLLLASMARSSFLIVVYSILVRRLARPLPKIFRDIIQAMIFAAVVLVTLRAAGVELGSLLATSAVLTAVIGLSLQDTLGNMFAGLAIQAQRPFEVGDWIQFDEKPENLGRVVEINWRATRVITIEQVEVTVPNGTIAKAPIRNYTKHTTPARRKVTVVAPYDMPPRQVQKILLASVKEMPGVLREPPPSVVTKDYTDRGVEYDLRFFIADFHEREPIAGTIRDRIWYSFRRAGIPIPTQVRTVHMHEISPATLERDRQTKLAARETALRCVDFLDALPDDARHRLAELTETRLFAPGETIIREGETGDELFIIEYGEVQVLIQRGNRGAVEVTRLGPNKFFGEMSVMTGERRRATVRATRETEVLVVNKDAFQTILESAPELAEKISQILAAREEELGEHANADASEAGVRASDRSFVLLNRIKEFFSL